MLHLNELTPQTTYYLFSEIRMSNMTPDPREICQLLRDFRVLCQVPVRGSDAGRFNHALDELELAAAELNKCSERAEPVAAGESNRIAA